MTYLATEESIQDGSPIELFLFQNAEDAYTYTSCNRTITYANRTYTPFPVKRTEPGIGSKISSSQMTLTMAVSGNNFSSRYLTGVPATPDRLTIYRQHMFDGALETIVYWTGSVATVTFEGDTVKVAINPASKVLEQSIPRRTYSYPCNHVLYDTLCKVNAQSFRSDVVINAISSDRTQLTVSNYAGWVGTSATARVAADASFFDAGFAQTNDGLKFRMILDYAVGTNIIKIPVPFENIQIGDILQLFGGCNHSAAACFDKFNNIKNYGGFPHVPLKNPFNTGVLT